MSGWCILCVLLLGCAANCAAPAGSQHAASEVVNAVSELSSAGSQDIVVRRLFEAGHELLQAGDAGGAIRVLILCRRLTKANAEIELVVAEALCRKGNLAGAHANFRLARALAQRLCSKRAEGLSRGRDRHGGGTHRCSDADWNHAQELMVASSARHGMCLMEARRFGDAAPRFRDALAIKQVYKFFKIARNTIT